MRTRTTIRTVTAAAAAALAGAAAGAVVWGGVVATGASSQAPAADAVEQLAGPKLPVKWWK